MWKTAKNLLSNLFKKEEIKEQITEIPVQEKSNPVLERIKTSALESKVHVELKKSITKDKPIKQTVYRKTPKFRI